MIALAIIAALAAAYIARRACTRAQRRYESTNFIPIGSVARSPATNLSRGRFTASPVIFRVDDDSSVHAGIVAR